MIYPLLEHILKDMAGNRTSKFLKPKLNLML